MKASSLDLSFFRSDSLTAIILSNSEGVLGKACYQTFNQNTYNEQDLKVLHVTALTCLELKDKVL